MNNRGRDLTGEIFGSLTVIGKTQNSHEVTWDCMCECGKTRVSKMSPLIKGQVTSCGCKNFTKPHANKKYDEKEASYRARVSSIKANAKARKIDWDLPTEIGLELIKANCNYCGKEPSQAFNVMTDKRAKESVLQINKADYDVLTSGIDRVDNNLGYIEGNVVSCCVTCNTGKMQQSLIEFKDWIKRVNKRIEEGGF